MTAAQAELYKKTKDRLRRLGKENPADVIIALAEEIELYRKKIRALEEFIAKHGAKHTEKKECPSCKHFIGCEPSTLGICDEYEEATGEAERLAAELSKCQIKLSLVTRKEEETYERGYADGKSDGVAEIFKEISQALDRISPSDLREFPFLTVCGLTTDINKLKKKYIGE